MNSSVLLMHFPENSNIGGVGTMRGGGDKVVQRSVGEGIVRYFLWGGGINIRGVG